MNSLKYDPQFRLITTSEKPIPHATVAVVADDRAQLLNGHEQLGNLLAAAPDLLKACKDAAEILSLARSYFPKSIKNRDTFSLLNVEANSVRKAIDKAEGRA